MQKITIKEIAKLTNTSVNTVSRALNYKDGVSKDTRELIEKVALKEGYRPNLLARSMRGLHTNLIGILVGEISNSFYTRILDGANEIANQEAMSLLIGSSDEHKEKELKQIDTFLSYRCSGIAVCLIDPASEIIATLKEEDVNFVVLDVSPSKNIDCGLICIDNERDSFLSVEELIKNGHRRIAILIPELLWKNECNRYMGYKRALFSYGIEEDPELVITCHSKDDAYRATIQLLGKKNRPTALYIAKQSFGLSVISALMAKDVRIPENISILMYGDPDWASILHPRITCMRRQAREMGRLGIKMLIDRIKGDGLEQKRKIVLDSKLMIRESVQRIKQAGAC